MQSFITLTDYLLLPVYIFLLYLVIKSKAAKYKADNLYTIYITAFFLHLFGAVLYAMVIQYYYGYGDSFGFFMGSNYISDITKEEATLKYFFYGSEQLSNLYLSSQVGDPSVGNVMNNAPNLMIMKISALLSFLSFNRYLIVTLFFGLFSFAGLWRLFITFNSILENKANRLLAITVLYVPSIWFWGSGLIKDSICLGCLGFSVNILYKIFIKKDFSIVDILQLGIFFSTLFVVKSYIAAALVAAILVFTVHFFMVNRKNVIERWFYSILILGAGAFILLLGVRSYVNTLIEDSKGTIDTFRSVYENMDNTGDAGSGFQNQGVDFTISGILLKTPYSIFTALYRPFPWEIKNLMMSFSSLESLVALAFFVYLLFKTRLKLFAYIMRDPFLLFSFVIVAILSMIIGFTTFNFGTMVRYRIPVLPFYSFILLSVYVKYREDKAAININV